MLLHNNLIFQCIHTTCVSILNLTTSNRLQCELACLSLLQCKVAIYYQATMNCQLFDDTLNQSANMSYYMDTATMIVIPGTRFPSESTVTALSPTSTSTTTTITTTTTTISLLSQTKNTTVYGIWNTIAGGASTPATPGTGTKGNYYPGEVPNNIFDDNTTTKYTNFGACVHNNQSTASYQCGEKTGFYFTLQQGPYLLSSVGFCTGNNFPERDPLTITIEGSNANSSALTLGASWTLIYNGSTGLEPISARYSCGAVQPVLDNSIWYSSYRFLVTSKRGFSDGTQYSEVKFYV